VRKIDSRDNKSDSNAERLDSFHATPLELSLKELAHINQRLHALGLMVFAFTISNIFILLAILGRTIFRWVAAEVIISISVTIGITFLIYVVRYERLHRKGDVIFEEISDELQWFIKVIDGKQKKTESFIADERPEIRARIVLRDFSRNTDLPFIPGKFGPAIYIAANVVILYFQLYYIRG
jgi:hypothetical protein